MNQSSQREGGFGLYIHVPYCLQRCSYCDFFTMPLGDNRADQFTPYLEALHKEIETLAPDWQGRPIQTLFMGGGTPSLLTPKELEAIFEKVHRYWTFTDDAEVTIEINPDTMNPTKASEYRSVGVNRASMGVQSLNPDGLRLLGRHHDVVGARRCFETLREAGFDNISCDMIYGWPSQTVEGWSAELSELLSWGPNHLSLYELILEPGTPMTRAVNKGELVLPTEEESLEMFRVTRTITHDLGLRWYEISNYAKEGCESRHNVGNWKGHDYLGVGPGAHSFRAKPGLGARRANPRNMPKYLERPEASPWKARSMEEVSVEAMMNGFRLREGWSAQWIQELYGFDLHHHILNHMDALEQGGLMISREEKFCLTEQGAEVLDAVVSHLHNTLGQAQSV